MLGVSSHVMMKGKKQGKRTKLKDVKVTYISSPMKVKTSASNFRALVQELTGQYSNVAEMFPEANNDAADGSVHHKGYSAQPWSEAYLPEVTNWLKPGYSQLDSRSSMEPLNSDLQFDVLSFDML